MRDWGEFGEPFGQQPFWFHGGLAARVAGVQLIPCVNVLITELGGKICVFTVGVARIG